jgi:hypothetical protein
MWIKEQSIIKDLEKFIGILKETMGSLLNPTE